MPFPRRLHSACRRAYAPKTVRRRVMRILVSGSRGVLGRALTPALEASGSQVIPFGPQVLPESGAASRPFEDVRNLDAVTSVSRRLDGVIHLAAVSRAVPAESNPALAESVNVGGTETVLRALREGSPRAWFILASSREVYGEPEYLPVNERHPTHPKGVYGRTKLASEAVVRAEGERLGRRAIILRFSNLYGDPADYPERVAPAFVSAALEGRPLEVRGPETLLDLLHLQDGVRAVLDAVRVLAEGRSGTETVNIASGRGVTLGELAEKVVAACASRSVVRETFLPPWATARFVGDPARAENLLGWRPRIDLDSGLRRFVRDWRQAKAPPAR